MNKFKTYYMWWQRSLRDQSFLFSPWKRTDYVFKGRSQKEARKKLTKFVNAAQITGRFLCVESGYELTTTGEETKSPIEQILESAIAQG